MRTLELSNNLSQFEKEKLCSLLECTNDELMNLYDKATNVYSETDTIYDALLKILQQGNNVREATLAGILCGKLMGFENAEAIIEEEIKEKLFNAFKNNRR